MPDRDDFGSPFQQVLDLYRLGRYHDALAIVGTAARRFPERAVDTTFWTACLLCRTGEIDQALNALAGGLQQGLWWAPDALRGEHDLDLLRARPDFQAIVAHCVDRQRAAQATARPELLTFPPANVDQSTPLLLALHGRGGNANDFAAHWMTAVTAGCLLALPQSSQVLRMGAFCWDDRELAEREIALAYAHLQSTYPFDSMGAIVAGYSQGGALAVSLALAGDVIPCRRFLAVAPSFPDASALRPLIARGAQSSARGRLLTGEYDYGRTRTEEVHSEIRRRGLVCELDVVPGLHHDFPADFAGRLQEALGFLRPSGSPSPSF